MSNSRYEKEITLSLRNRKQNASDPASYRHILRPQGVPPVLSRLKGNNILAFMERNVVVVNTPDFANLNYSNLAKKKLRLHLVQRQGETCAGPHGAGLVYNLIPGRDAGQSAANSHSFIAYWVEYHENGGVGTWLGDECDVMFTATMSGCSFGLGSRTPNGVRAAHSNSAAVFGTHHAKITAQNPTMDGVEAINQSVVAQIYHQHKRLVALGAGERAAHPDRYLLNAQGKISTAISTTPFGIRVGGNNAGWGWKVYWQRYAGLGRDQVSLLGVDKHISGRKLPFRG